MTEEQIKQKADDYVITRQEHIKYFSGEAVKILLKNFAEEIVAEATKELEAQIEKMKCCRNCRHPKTPIDNTCVDCERFSKWELRR